MRKTRVVYPLIMLITSLLVAGFVYAREVGGIRFFTRDVNSAERSAAMKDLVLRLAAVKADLANDRVIAKVNGSPIYLSDFALKQAVIENRRASKGLALPESSEVLAAVVREKLLAEEAKRLGVFPSDAEVRKDVSETRKKFESTADPELIRAFEMSGLTNEYYWNEVALRLHRQLIIVVNINNAVMEKNPRHAGELNEAYRKRIYRLNERRMQELIDSAHIEILDKKMLK